MNDAHIKGNPVLGVGETRVGTLMFFNNDEPTVITMGSISIAWYGRVVVRIPGIQGLPENLQSKIDPKRLELLAWHEYGGDYIIFVDMHGPVRLDRLVPIDSKNGRQIQQFEPSETELLADSAYFGIPDIVGPEFLLPRLNSRIFGLAEFSMSLARASDVAGCADVHPAPSKELRVTEKNLALWTDGRFRYEIIERQVAVERTEAHQSTFDREIYLRTTGLSAPAAEAEHLDAQRAVRNVLAIAFGVEVGFTSHSTGAAEPEASYAHIPMLLTETAQDVRKDRSGIRLPQPLFTLESLGSQGLHWFTQQYMQDVLAYVYDVIAVTINHGNSTLEAHMLMLSMAVEHYAYRSIGKKKESRVKRYFEHVFKPLGSQIKSFGNLHDISQAAANIYNSLKHPDRNIIPSSLSLQFFVELIRTALIANVAIDLQEQSAEPISTDAILDSLAPKFDQLKVLNFKVESGGDVFQNDIQVFP